MVMMYNIFYFFQNESSIKSIKRSCPIAEFSNTLNIMDLPEEMLMKIIRFLPADDALWKLGFVCKTLLRLSLRAVKIIPISDRDPSKLETLTRRRMLNDVIRHAIMTKHTDSIGRRKLLYNMKRDSKDGKSNILDFNGEPTDEDILVVAKNCKNLESLYLIDCDRISDLAFGVLLKSCKRLKTLNICNCRQLKDVSFKAIASNCKGIVNLDLGNCCNITDEAITDIGSTCKNLESLDLFGCRQITDVSMVGITNQCKRLNKLSLSHCPKIRDEGIIHLVTNCSSIHNLDLTNCVHLTNKTVFIIAEKCPALNVLILVKCDKLTIEPMESLISQCNDLKYMDIKGSLNISDDKIKRLWVRYGKKLQSLNTGRTCLEEMEKIREVMYDGTLSKEDFDKWRLEFYTGERSPILNKNVG